MDETTRQKAALLAQSNDQKAARLAEWIRALADRRVERAHDQAVRGYDLAERCHANASVAAQLMDVVDAGNRVRAHAHATLTAPLRDVANYALGEFRPLLLPLVKTALTAGIPRAMTLAAQL